jgi:hypothetical protein
MKKIFAQTLVCKDPVFGDAMSALGWVSPRADVSRRDGLLIKDYTVASIHYSDSRVVFGLNNGDLNLNFIIYIQNSQPVWILRTITTEMVSHGVHPENQAVAQDALLLFPLSPYYDEKEVSTREAWSRQTQASKWIRRTMGGLYATNDCLYVYPAKGEPMSFSVIGNIETKSEMLYWLWDEYLTSADESA